MDSKVNIELFQPGMARVFINDVEVRNVQSIEVQASVGNKLNTVRLTLIPNEISITGMADTSEQFAVLGTPPEAPANERIGRQ